MTGEDFEDGDVTPGGSRIVKSKARTNGWSAPESENCELIQEHLKPVEESRLNGAMIDFSILLPQDRSTLTLPDGDHLNFFGVRLLYPEEMAFKLRGCDALTEKLNRSGVTEVVNLSRRSVIRKNPVLRLIGRD